MTDGGAEFSGDVLLVSTDDGGDIVLKDGMISACRNFITATYLSLFGGNRGDADRRPKETWWGNLVPGTEAAEWMHSEFGATVEGLALTSASLRTAAAAAARDLAWTKEVAGADAVDVSLSAESGNRVVLSAEILKEGEGVGGGDYAFQWRGAMQKNGI